METNGKITVTKKITVSAFSEDYNENSYKFHYGNKNFEFVPKSQVVFVEHNGSTEFGTGIESRFFEMPVWLFARLKGIEFYGI